VIRRAELEGPPDVTRPAALAPVTRPDRAAAVPDRIFLRDHVVAVEIGAFQAERGVTQRVRFNLTADLAQPPAGARRDDVDAILSYDVLAQAIADELAAGRVNLLETLAEAIAARVLAVPGVAQVQVGVEKLDRIEGALGVEITRSAPRAAPPPNASPIGARVLLVAEHLLAEPALAEPLRTAIGSDPAVLCVAAAPPPGPREAPAVQRRIDLLAFEQAAWRLAARDRGFVVVDSRAELDWGLRNGQISVWAPSKMVVDAREDAPADPLEMGTLALWLAGRIGAARLECCGVSPPATGGPVPVVTHDLAVRHRG